jgi:predicted CXXCH cytochrome family protein
LITPGGERKISFHSGAGAPAGWGKYRAHPPAAECTTCHNETGGVWVLKNEVAGPVCMTCHDSATFPKSHTHKPAELEECQMCHDPHGSTVSRHLLMEKSVACKQCHG